jgi:hypothetical protein
VRAGTPATRRVCWVVLRSVDVAGHGGAPFGHRVMPSGVVVGSPWFYVGRPGQRRQGHTLDVADPRDGGAAATIDRSLSCRGVGDELSLAVNEENLDSERSSASEWRRTAKELLWRSRPHPERDASSAGTVETL